MSNAKTKSERPAPVLANTLAMTLDELDEVTDLVESGTCRRQAAIAVVWCRNRRTRFGALTPDQAKALTLRDFRIVESEEDDDERDPTDARS